MKQKSWNPKEYDKQCVLQYNTAMEMLNTLELSGDEKILDIGCGTGKISFQIAKERLSCKGMVLGIDLNDGMVGFAKQNYQADNLTFDCKNVLNLDYEAEFDLAISFWTLSWIPLSSQLDALENIIRSLKVDGKLLLMYPLRHDAYDVVNEVIGRPKWSFFFQHFPMPRPFITEEQYQQDIIRNLSMEISVQKTELECRYKSDQEMIDSINCWLTHVDQIPSKEDKNQFLIDVSEAYKKHRGITVPTMYYSVLELSGQKPSLQYELGYR